MKRRTLLTVLGATATATTAGCLTNDNSDNSDSTATTGSLETAPGSAPKYARWLSANASESLLIRLDFEQASAIDSYDLSAEQNAGSNEDLDLSKTFTDVSGLAEAFPAGTAVGPLFFLAFLQLGYPFVQDISYAGGEEVTNPVMNADSIMLADNGLVLSGSVDEQAIKSSDSVAQVDSYEGYRIYGSSNDGTTPGSGEDSNYSPFAVSETELVFPLGDSQGESGAESSDRTDRERLNAALETSAAGIQTNLADLEWLLKQCGDGALVLAGGGEELTTASESDNSSDSSTDLGTFGIDKETVDEFETLLEEEDTSAVAMVVDDSDSGRVTRSGFAFPSADSVPDEKRLANVLAGDASDRNILVADNRIVVEAFWE